MTTKLPIREGDTVRVLPPHRVAGIAGTVAKVYRANSHYDRRALVEFTAPTLSPERRGYSEPYPGTQIITLDMLERIER